MIMKLLPILVEDRCRIGVDIKQHVVRAEMSYELVAQGNFTC